MDLPELAGDGRGRVHGTVNHHGLSRPKCLCQKAALTALPLFDRVLLDWQYPHKKSKIPAWQRLLGF